VRFVGTDETSAPAGVIGMRGFPRQLSWRGKPFD